MILADPRTETIYGGFEEHPEYPITDPRRFSVHIVAHIFTPDRAYTPSRCKFCGQPEGTAIHSEH